MRELELKVQSIVNVAVCREGRLGLERVREIWLEEGALKDKGR